MVTHAVSIVQLHPENDAWCWMHKQREREREMEAAWEVCVSVFVRILPAVFSFAENNFAKSGICWSRRSGVLQSEEYLANNKSSFIMTCIKNLLPAEVNSLQLRQTQVLVLFLKQKQHLKM